MTRVGAEVDEVQGLIDQLSALDDKLDHLLGGQVDSVRDSQGRTLVLRRAQDALRQGGSARHADVLNALAAEVAVVDGAGTIVSVNDAWCQFARDNGLLAADHGVGLSYLDACDRAAAAGAREAQQVAAGLRAVLAGTAASYALEYPCDLPDRKRWFMLRAKPLEGSRGGGAVILNIDITVRKQATEDLLRLSLETERRERLFHTMLSSITDMTYAADRHGRLLYANAPCLKVWGLSLEQALGKTVRELGYPPDLANRVEGQIATVFETGKILVDETEFVGHTGYGCYEYILAPALAPDGSVEFMVGCSRDITARKRTQDALSELNASLEARVRDRTAELALAREEADRANDAKSAFLAAMSHEIRTPMAGLLGLLELLDLTPLDRDQQSTLAVARESGRSLKQIMDSILDFTKIEADALELYLTTGSVARVVEGICRLHAPLASAKAIPLRTSIDPRLSRSHRFDNLRFGQIVSNLLGNAIKFTDQGSIALEVEFDRAEAGFEHLRLRVRDTGIGIAPEQIGRLFEPYAQADARISTSHGGTGLGLFISRRLAQLMGGTLALESSPGFGTAVTLSVAFETADEAMPVDSPGEPGDASRHRLNALIAERRPDAEIRDAQTRGKLLLIVDDHPINRMVLLRQARALGYAAEAVAGGAEALKAWESRRFAVILTDCNMPGVSGFDLAREIRSREAGSGSHTPIVGCTANALASATQACLAVGMDDAVTKPVALADLCDKLDRWLPKRPRELPRADAAPVRRWGTQDAGATELLDLAHVDEMADGDAVLRRRLLQEFRQTNQDDGCELRRVIAARDFEQAAQLSHRLRGACAMMGASRLTQACMSLQMAASSALPQQVEVAMERFELALRELDERLGLLGRSG